eukprot:7604579-Pyramimonas_sp.AAC.1
MAFRVGPPRPLHTARHTAQQEGYAGHEDASSLRSSGAGGGRTGRRMSRDQDEKEDEIATGRGGA